jgi:TonB family protein
MNRPLLVAFLLFIGALRLCGQGSSADFNPWSHNSSAVDAKGVHHDPHSYKGNPPWLVDRVGGPAPEYPIDERRMRHQGNAIVRLTLDLKTGHVVKASLLKSSGYPTLDKCAIAAFSRWTWRPGKWKEIDLPVTFRMGNASQPPPPGSIRLPRS